MNRLAAALAIATALIAGPASAQPVPRAGGRTEALKPPAVAPGSTVNEATLKRIQAEQDARAKAWDAKLKKTMLGVCKGC